MSSWEIDFTVFDSDNTGVPWFHPHSDLYGIASGDPISGCIDLVLCGRDFTREGEAEQGQHAEPNPKVHRFEHE
jgi:hypothetical protein